MFGTLKAGNNAGMVFIERVGRNRGGPRVACKLCRQRKLKCSGEPTGCQRCKPIGSHCEYSSSTDHRRKRNKGETEEPPVPSNQPSRSAEGCTGQARLERRASSVQSVLPDFENMRSDSTQHSPTSAFDDTAMASGMIMDDMMELEMVDDGNRDGSLDPSLLSEDYRQLLSMRFDLDDLPDLDTALTASSGSAVNLGSPGTLDIDSKLESQAIVARSSAPKQRGATSDNVDPSTEPFQTAIMLHQQDSANLGSGQPAGDSLQRTANRRHMPSASASSSSTRSSSQMQTE
ncbi:hypothetical protein QBC46DRAFT_167934 [Diplogelasinospora grovesii]|uniref:Zn(2)-C6 fungal-type domain-containing protein n=1 Tax=Diplogelasinospora grovesii TaxID=303347 RepID=A0AAN6N3C4_9PEZI|nr:hypothetical protein QBC46DRAFT_167934 [Diplogelasinospora grovesii]